MEKLTNKYNNAAIIDADFIIWIAVNGNKVLDSEGQPLREDGRFVYSDKTVKEATDTCDSYLNDVLNLSKADSYIMCLTAPNNFRYKVDSTYKANRVGMPIPLWHKEVKQHMKDHWGAIDCPGLEADDMVVILSNHLENCFIVAVDKDILDCVPGRHYDARKGHSGFTVTSEEHAKFKFAVSLLVGDKIDGIPNIKKGYGPKTAEKELLSFGEEDLEQAALNVYVKEFGLEEGTEKFNKQKRLLKMIESLDKLPENVTFEIPEPQCFQCTETTFSGGEYQLILDL